MRERERERGDRRYKRGQVYERERIEDIKEERSMRERETWYR